MGKFSKKIFPAPGNNRCPRKLSVPRRVQGYRIHRSSGSPCSGSNPIVAHGVGVPSDQIISELSSFLGMEQRLIRPRGCEPTPIELTGPIPAVKPFAQANALATSKGTWSFMT